MKKFFEKKFMRQLMLVFLVISNSEATAVQVLADDESPTTETRTIPGDTGEYVVRDTTGTMIPPSGVHSPGGAVDVTPLEVKELADGRIEYSYQVSVQAIQSSDHRQTAATVHTAIPGFATDVTFTQIGTYDRQSLAISSDEILHSGKSFRTLLLEKRMAAAKDVSVSLGITDSQETFLNTISDRNQLLSDAGLDGAVSPQSLAWNEEVVFRESQGLTTIPNAILFAGYTSDFSEDFGSYDESNATLSGTIKNYQYSVIGDGHPLAVKVSFTVSKEQASQTPNLPLWTALLYKDSSEMSLSSAETGAQRLYDFGDVSTAAGFVAHPAYINSTQFDKNGLYGTSTGVTAYTGDWKLVGNDLTGGHFNYTATFNLWAQPSVGFYAPTSEDTRDIAVLHYEATPAQVTPESPEVSQPSTPESTTPSSLEPDSSPDSGSTSDTTPTADAPVQDAAQRVLPKTGEKASIVVFYGAIVGLLVSTGMLFFKRRKQ